MAAGDDIFRGKNSGLMYSRKKYRWGRQASLRQASDIALGANYDLLALETVVAASCVIAAPRLRSLC